MVLDLKLPDMTGFELIEQLQADNQAELPIIVYTGKELTRKEELHLRRVAASVIIKEADSPERLLADTALFLHRIEANLPEPKRKMIEELNRRDPVLADRKVLVVDDDVRNIFALTSALESYNMKVVHAENGQKGIDLLKATPGIDAVLMDIMMPEMNGYEAISAIRTMDMFKNLPIIALTAKAMKADRDHCLKVGASDYISKPLDIDHLFSLLRVWLSREEEQS
jgi:CheY-like chemotaxis protein